MVKKISLDLPIGDVTEADRRLYHKVIKMYKMYRRREKDFPPRAKARALLSFVYDFLHLGMDETSDLLMIEIGDVCPDYFHGFCKEDMNDPRFEKMCLKVADFYDNIFKDGK
jgi:hypothetical protein